MVWVKGEGRGGREGAEEGHGGRGRGREGARGREPSLRISHYWIFKVHLSFEELLLGLWYLSPFMRKKKQGRRTKKKTDEGREDEIM